MSRETGFDSRVDAWEHLRQLNEKVYACHRAYTSVEGEVKDLENFDTPTVLDIAGRYAAYDLQLRVLAEDQGRLQDELEGHDASQALDIHRGWRMELEAAVRDAQLGNYTLLKQWFKVCQSRQEGTTEGVWIDLNLQAKLEKIIQVLPGQSEPLKLPTLAWQDPKYNTKDP